MTENAELIARLRNMADCDWVPGHDACKQAADALESAGAENARLEAELAAIKAQEPAAWLHNVKHANGATGVVLSQSSDHPYLDDERPNYSCATVVSTPLYAAPVAQPAQTRELSDAAKKDAVFQASIDFIRELTGMEPPPIEVAPSEAFRPSKIFADKVCDIFAVPKETTK